ncbi:MAG: methyltransferase domain-containing protein [Sedimentisphaerales bacterium]|nr:methyltransferase domain-containing protein [Sedimentisphaerales bacterium]
MNINENHQKTIFAGVVEKDIPFKGDKVCKVLYGIVKKYIEDDILDIGAGSGALIDLLNSKGYHATGIDLNPVSNKVQFGTITEPPFPDCRFGTVFCCDILEHLTDEQLTGGIKQVFRVLKDDGRFIISTPFAEDLRHNAVVCPECKAQFHRFGHLQTFTDERIKNIFQKSGFDVKLRKVCSMGVAAKIPLGRYFHWLFNSMNFEFIEKTIIVVAQKKRT